MNTCYLSKCITKVISKNINDIGLLKQVRKLFRNPFYNLSF